MLCVFHLYSSSACAMISSIFLLYCFVTFSPLCGFILGDVLYDQMLLGKYFSQLRA